MQSSLKMNVKSSIRGKVKENFIHLIKLLN